MVNMYNWKVLVDWNIHRDTYTYVCVHIYTHALVLVVYNDAYRCICMYVCMYIRIYTHIKICNVYIRIYVRTYVLYILSDYTAIVTSHTVGPYYIASHDMESGKTIYLKAGLGSTLITTIIQCEASPFKIIPNEDDEKEFHIAYEAQDGDDPDMPTFRYYLTTRHKFSGVHSEPPSLEQHPKESNATFALHSQLHEWINTQEKLEEWISEGKCFLINCENRKWARDSYFALKRDTGNDKKEEPPSHNFFPVCERYTNENDDLLFAFKLIRCPYGGKTPKQEQQQQQQQQ